MELKELLNQISLEQENYSPSQKLVADYVLKNYKQIPFYSITTLSEKIGVSHYSVISFCKSLGYSKFSEFKKELSQYASDLIIYNKLSQNDECGEEEQDHHHLFDQALSDDIEAVQATLTNPANRDNLPKLVEMINSAQYIYVTGGRTSSHLAGLLACFLRYLNLKVIELTSERGDYWDRLAMVTPKDLVIGISFPRYTAQVVNGLANLHDAGVPIVLITDSGLSPARPYADLVFGCAMESTSYIQCYAGCLALISAICRVVGNDRKGKAADYLRRLEKHLLDQGTYM